MAKQNKEYVYVDCYQCDENGKSSPWKRKHLDDVPKWQHEEAKDFNCFATVQKYANEKKTEGEDFLAPLYFDLDYSENPAVAQEEAIKLVEFFTGELDIQEQDLHIYFSGSKGFHILVDERALGVEPRKDLQRVYKHIAGYLRYRLGEVQEQEDENGRPVEYTEPLKAVDLPICLYQWVGKQHSKVRDMLPKIIRYWGAIGGVCDGTGIGEPLAYHLKELFDRNNDGLVEAYKFKAAGDESKSKLGYLAYDFNHNDLIKVPKAPEDPDQLELWKELRWQVEHLTREAKRQQTINFYVPANAEPRKPGHVPHDDLVMALFLLMRAARNIDPNTGKATAFDREKSGV